MTKDQTTEQSAVTVGFIRGERSLNELRSAGIWPEPLKTGEIRVENRSNVSVPVSFVDFARGLLANLHRPEVLRVWGLAVYAAGVLSDDFQSDPRGEILLEALMDASFGEEIKKEAVAVAEHIVADDERRAELAAPTRR